MVRVVEEAVVEEAVVEEESVVDVDFEVDLAERKATLSLALRMCREAAESEIPSVEEVSVTVDDEEVAVAVKLEDKVVEDIVEDRLLVTEAVWVAELTVSVELEEIVVAEELEEVVVTALELANVGRFHTSVHCNAP